MLQCVVCVWIELFVVQLNTDLSKRPFAPCGSLEQILCAHSRWGHSTCQKCASIQTSCCNQWKHTHSFGERGEENKKHKSIPISIHLHTSHRILGWLICSWIVVYRELIIQTQSYCIQVRERGKQRRVLSSCACSNGIHIHYCNQWNHKCSAWPSHASSTLFLLPLWCGP